MDTADGVVEQPLGPRRPELTEPVPARHLEVAPPATAAPPVTTGELRVFVRTFLFSGNRVMPTARLRALAAPFEGREITDTELQELRRRLSALYAEAGYVASSVTVPDQDIADGVIVLEVDEGRLAGVRVRGARQFDADYLARWIESGIDAPLQVRQLEDHLSTLLQDPAVAGFEPRLVPGAEPGSAELSVDVIESPQFGARVGIADDRSPALGGVRGELELLARNLIGRGDSTSVSVEGSKGLQVVDARTDVPLTLRGTRLQFRFADYDAHVVEAPLDALDIESETRIVELGLQQALVRNPRRAVHAGIAIEGRDSDSFLLGRPFSFSPGAENGRSRVRVARLRLSWLERGRRDVLSVQGMWSVGLDVLGATVHDDRRPDSEFHAGLVAAQWLHAFDDARGQVYARFQFQKAGDNLLPLEKMAIGGSRSVRGYRRARLIRDSAWDGSVEYRLPLAALPVPGLSADGEGRLSAVAFVDAGRAWNEENGPERGNRTLLGAGPGLRWEVSRALRAEFYWAAATRDLGFRKTDMQDHGLHFQVAYATDF